MNPKMGREPCGWLLKSHTLSIQVGTRRGKRDSGLKRPFQSPLRMMFVQILGSSFRSASTQRLPSSLTSWCSRPHSLEIPLPMTVLGLQLEKEDSMGRVLVPPLLLCSALHSVLEAGQCHLLSVPMVPLGLIPLDFSGGQWNFKDGFHSILPQGPRELCRKAAPSPSLGVSRSLPSPWQLLASVAIAISHHPDLLQLWVRPPWPCIPRIQGLPRAPQVDRGQMSLG